MHLAARAFPVIAAIVGHACHCKKLFLFKWDVINIKLVFNYLMLKKLYKEKDFFIPFSPIQYSSVQYSGTAEFVHNQNKEGIYAQH